MSENGKVETEDQHGGINLNGLICSVDDCIVQAEKLLKINICREYSICITKLEEARHRLHDIKK